MAIFYLPTSEEDPYIPVKCLTGVWLILDMYNFALSLFNKASGLLYRLALVTDKHRQLTDCITGFGNQKWDADHNLKKISDIMSPHRSFAAWTTLPLYDFQSCSLLWPSTQRCMDHYYYGQQSRSRSKKLPRYPTKCKGIFSFDFGQSVFIEEFGYLGWMEMSAQCKLIDMTDFSPKAKRPTFPKLNSTADLLSCVDNLINLSIIVFKPEIVGKITRLKSFLHRNQNEIKERVQQSPAIVERLAGWTNDMLRRLRMGFEAGTSEMLNEYRTRLHVNASEYAHVMTSAMWDSIARIKPVNHSTEGILAARDGFRKRGRRDNVKEQIARFQLIRKAVPPHGGKNVCFHNLTAKGCSGGANTSSKDGFCHFVPKKSDITADAMMTPETNLAHCDPN
jgi:hypothetical protein